MSKHILIIKLGYAETLVNEKGFVPSLGDVFRHTVLLHHYANDHVVWLTSRSAAPLLKYNSYIDELLIYEDGIIDLLNSRSFDEVLCLEKAPSLCRLAQSLTSERYYGFTWNEGCQQAHPGAETALAIANGLDQFLPLQSLIYQMVGAFWNGEDYILGYEPRSQVTADIGLNYLVGSKWPTKAWPDSHWRALAQLCENHGFSVTWQQGHSDLRDYMDWINSARCIVTADSLGMHLGLAMKKKVIALFGPTTSNQINMYGRGIIMTSEWACPDAPCAQPDCTRSCVCMSEIRPNIVARTINNILNGDRPNIHQQHDMRQENFDASLISGLPLRKPDDNLYDGFESEPFPNIS